MTRPGGPVGADRGRALFLRGDSRAPIVCAICARRFQRVHGTPNHGWKHVREGKATWDLEPSAQDHRYVFFVRQP